MRQVTDFFHPVTAPRAGIKIRDNSKRTAGDFLEPFTNAIAGYKLWLGAIRVQKKIGCREQLLCQAVGCAPIHKKGAFVFQTWSLAEIVRTQVRNLIAPLSSLYFPARHVGIDKNVRVWGKQRGADANN